MRKRLFALMLSIIMVVAFTTTAYATEDGSSTTSSNDDGSASINGRTYFYDQFDNAAYRTVYNQISEAAETFQSSRQNASYQDEGYYTAFVLTVSNKDWEVIGSDGMSQVMNAVLADHPEYFWMSENYICQQKSSGQLSYTELTVECYSIYANGSTRSVYVDNFDLAVKAYASGISEDAADYEKVYVVHNAIIDDVYYATDITSRTEDNIYAYTADGVFNSKYRSAVTYGYAKAFKAVMDYVGVPCLYIEGQNSDLLDDSVATQKEVSENGAINNCAWNAVYLDGDWYLVNPGLDDPVTTTGKNALSYSYFNLTDAKASNLTAIKTRLPGIPSCEGTTYTLEKVQEELESGGLWVRATYNFIDRLLDTYGLSVVLISTGLILLLLLVLINKIGKKRKARKKKKVKKTQTTVVDHSELDDELRKPPIS